MGSDTFLVQLDSRRLRLRVAFAAATMTLLIGSISSSAMSISCESMSVRIATTRAWQVYHSDQQSVTLVADQMTTPGSSAAITIQLRRDSARSRTCDNSSKSTVAGIPAVVCHRKSWQRDAFEAAIPLKRCSLICTLTVAQPNQAILQNLYADFLLVIRDLKIRERRDPAN
jgi:hypothetical protein